MKRCALLLAILGCSGIGAANAAAIQNGNFASFSGWNGYADNNVANIGPVDPSLYGNLYTLVPGGQARLTTDPLAVDNFFRVDLTQSFAMPAATGLSFGYAWTVSSAGTDLPYAFLIDTQTNDMIDLFTAAGVSVLASAGSGTLTVNFSDPLLAFNPSGHNVQLLFRIEDNGDNTADSLTIGNIAITGVPAPSSVALLAAGLLGRWFGGRRLQRGRR
jgi:hypothetical protein